MGAGEAAGGVQVGGHPHQDELDVKLKDVGHTKFIIIIQRFELATQEEVDKLGKSNATSSSSGFDTLNLLDEDVDKTLHIKGQMVYMKEWEQMLFLACPMMKDLNNLMW